MNRRRWLYAVLCVSAGVLVVCSDDDDAGNGPVPPATIQIRVANALTPVWIDTNRRLDSIVIYGLAVNDTSYGTLHAGDTTVFAAIAASGTTVSVTADSFRVYFQICTPGCSPRVSVISDPGPYVFTLDGSSNLTLVLDTGVVGVGALITTTTTVGVNNQMLAIPLPQHGGYADSVHMYGVRIGSLQFGTIRAGQTSAYQTTNGYGSQTLTVDSLVVVRGITRTTLTRLSPLSITVNQYMQNTIAVGASDYPIDALLPGGGGETTRVRIRNQLIRFNDTEGDSVVAVILRGVRVSGVNFGDVDTGQTTPSYAVTPRNNTVTLTFQRVEVWDVICVGPRNCFEQMDLGRECADSVLVVVQTGQDNLINFAPGAAVTADLWDGMRMCP